MNKKANIDPSSGFLIRATTNILRPFVKLMIANNITFPMLSELLKRIYVDVATSDYKLRPDEEITDSRVTLLTKVHRKDVRRFREESKSPTEDQTETAISAKNISLGAQIIAKWLADKKYTDKSGKPLPLFRLASKSAGKPSFERLVESINNDIRSRPVLDELISQGIITENNKGLLLLNQSAFIPKENNEQLINHFSRNLHDHMAAAAHNIEANKKNDGRLFLERSVFYNGLSEASIRKLEALIEKHGMENLVAINKAAYVQAMEDKSAEDAKQRLTFGIYYYSEKDDS